MPINHEIIACILNSMVSRLDPYMLEQGFSRTKSSLIYKRSLRGSTQKVDLSIQAHPKDNPNAAVAVYPQMEVLIPAADAILTEMIGDNPGLLEGITGGTSKQPIAFTSEKSHDGRWFVYQPDSVPEMIDGIRAFIEQWTMPLLDAYSTAEDVLAVDQREDRRLARDRAQMMRVVAAALTIKRKDYAQAMMEKWLGSPGTRRRYERVYDYIQRTT
jgi:hypothetical protein